MFFELELKIKAGEVPAEAAAEITALAQEMHGGIKGSVAVSDAFFPKRDGVDACIKEGATAIVQPGGSLADKEVIDVCNAAGIAMVFTGQRAFRH